MNKLPVFSILDYMTQDKIAEVVATLGNQQMQPSSHGYEKYFGKTIIEAAREQAQDFLSQTHRNAAISLMDVVLAANRNYNRQVEPHVTKIRRNWPNLTLSKLKGMIAARDYIQFEEIWGHKDQKKYDVLRQLIDASLSLPTQPDWSDDYDRMHAWAKATSIGRWKEDPIGKIKNVGIATFQHLRISFGIDTVKPDQRVREVLAKEFGAQLSPELAIQAIEQIASIANMKTIEVDQVFVKYGSGYYGTERI